jgi:hypothetical protein
VLYSAKPYQLFLWTGEARPQHNITVRCKHLTQDAYTNTYCQAIAACKAPSNSNVIVTVGSRATIYASCYSAKATQKEDTDEFKHMASFVANRFLQQWKDDPLFEGLSRLMGSVIVGTSLHVSAAPMAAYLVQNQSRFRFSTRFQYVPIREIIDVLCHPINRDRLTMSVLPHDTGCFLNQEALHYILRPNTPTFQPLSLFEFYTKFEVVRRSFLTNNSNNLDTFEIDDPEHPGYHKQVFSQRNANNPCLAQFSHVNHDSLPHASQG